MRATDLRPLGRTGVELTQLGFGAAPLGELFARVGEEKAEETLGAAWDAGLRYYDTAPWYGRGLSEHRVGRFLRGRDRGAAVLSTKVGRRFFPPRDRAAFDRAPWLGGLAFEHVHDYGYDGLMRSYEQSQMRLGFDRIDLLVIHDLDFWHHGSEARVAAHLAQLYTSGWRALEELRADGRVRGVGAGINETGMIARLLDMMDLDFVLVALRYTLLDQGVLDHELPLCEARGVGVVVGGVFNSGILATGAVEGAKHDYADASPEILERVRRMEAVCRTHDVALPGAALRFPLGHPAVASVIPGAIGAGQVARNVEAFERPVPPALWADLKAEGLLRADAPTP